MFDVDVLVVAYQFGGSFQTNLIVLSDVIVGGMSDTLNDSLEAQLGIGGVLDDAFGAIRLVQGVHSLDVVSVAVLPLLFVVPGVVVLHSVFEFVRNRSLFVDHRSLIVSFDQW